MSSLSPDGRLIVAIVLRPGKCHLSTLHPRQFGFWRPQSTAEVGYVGANAAANLSPRGADRVRSQEQACISRRVFGVAQPVEQGRTRSIYDELTGDRVALDDLHGESMRGSRGRNWEWEYAVCEFERATYRLLYMRGQWKRKKVRQSPRCPSRGGVECTAAGVWYPTRRLAVKRSKVFSQMDSCWAELP